MHKDLYNNAKTVIAVGGTTLAGDGDTVGGVIDTDNFESGKISVIITALTTGDVTISKIQESSDSGMSGATDIPAERIIGTATAVVAANALNEIGFVSTERYVQVTITGANTSVLSFISLCELANPSSASVRG